MPIVKRGSYRGQPAGTRPKTARKRMARHYDWRCTRRHDTGRRPVTMPHEFAAKASTIAMNADSDEIAWHSDERLS